MPPLYALINTALAREKNGGQAIGRSRGGLTTKVHALVDALGNPCNLMLTPGQHHDLTCAHPLLENADPRALIGDKAYDADSLIDTLNQRAITPVIPPKANRKVKRDCDFALYRERNLVERFFNKIKHARRKVDGECFRGLRVDDEFELGCPHHRKVHRFLAFRR